MNQVTIGFTGPRPNNLFGYDPNNNHRYQKLVEEMAGFFTDYIIAHNPTGGIVFLSGGAQGADMCAFAAIERVKQLAGNYNIQNNLVLPHPNQHLKWGDNGLFSRQNYQQMLQLANRVVYIQPNVNLPIRAEDYHRRNQYIVDHADSMFVIGSVSHLKSSNGTKSTYEKAIKAGKPTTFLFDIDSFNSNL